MSLLAEIEKSATTKAYKVVSSYISSNQEEKYEILQYKSGKLGIRQWLLDKDGKSRKIANRTVNGKEVSVELANSKAFLPKDKSIWESLKTEIDTLYE